MPVSILHRALFAAMLGHVGILNAAPVNIISANQFRDIRSENSVNFETGDRHLISVFATPVTGTTVEAANGSTIVPLPSVPDRPIEFVDNFEFGSIPVTPWTVTARNGSDTSIALTNSLVGVDQLDFVRNARITPNGLTPTLRWDLPSGFGGVNDFLRVGYFDDETNFRLPINGASFFDDLSPTQTSYTFADGTLEFGRAYVFRVITARQAPGIGQTRATTFLNFTPIPGSGGPDVYIPTVDDTGVFNFDIDVLANEPVILDPVVATGYAYEVEQGNPKFASVLLPAIGDNNFILSYVDPNTGQDIVQTLMADVLFSFPTDGVDRFLVQGIETSVGLNPGDATAFMTQVSFFSDGIFSGTMTPITQFVGDQNIPLPAPLLLMIGGLTVLFFRNGYRREKAMS